jgi:hypothetical protein
MPYAIYVEVGARRVFAGALDWPGWCRSGRDESEARQALIAYGRRYAVATREQVRGFKPPQDVADLEVVERLKGNATTDFGGPAVVPAKDSRSLNDAEAKRLTAILKAAWTTFDRASEAAQGLTLRKGPRGGGRELDAIARHVLEAERAYLSRLGGVYRKARDARLVEDIAGVRAAILDALASRVRGEAPPTTRPSSTVWPPQYFVRRCAWHALDHAWEIEDRAEVAVTKAKRR